MHMFTLRYVYAECVSNPEVLYKQKSLETYRGITLVIAYILKSRSFCSVQETLNEYNCCPNRMGLSHYPVKGVGKKKVEKSLIKNVITYYCTLPLQWFLIENYFSVNLSNHISLSENMLNICVKIISQATDILSMYLKC